MEGMIDKIKKLAKIKLIGGAILSFIGTFTPLFVILVGALILLGLAGDGDKVASEEECVPVQSADSICESISVAGHGTMSVDEYVAGVVEHEFGGAPDEVLKAQAVAARSYGLHGATKDGDGNCSIGDTSQAFQTFSSNPSERSKKAAEDTSGMIMVDDNGDVVRTEYSSNSLQKAYDSFGDTILMSERDLEVPRSWFSANKTCSDSELNSVHGAEKDNYGRAVYGCGHGRGMGQIAAKYLADEKGYDFKEILEFFYGQDSTYKATLASTNGSTSEICTGGNLQTLDHYTLYHEGLDVLNHPLSDSELEDLNSYIVNEVNKAGHGSSAAVAAAGQGLIYWLEMNKKAYLGYYWAGGHGFGGDDSLMGGNPEWGSTKYGADKRGRQYYGMDCSGFVSWSTRQGCNPGFGADVSGGWDTRGTALSSLAEAEPGDVLSNDGHVMLIVKNNGDGSVYTAEETGSYGLIFSQRSTIGNYNLRSMKSWYASNCTDIQPPSGDSGVSSGHSTGKGKILLIAGHSFPPYCYSHGEGNECRDNNLEPKETRKVVRALKSKLMSMGYKNSDVDIANELLGEDLNDTSTSRSVYMENRYNHSYLMSKINFKNYKYAIEIHFNAGGGSGPMTLSYDCGNVPAIDSKIRSNLAGVLGTGNIGCRNRPELKNVILLRELGLPFTYLETENTLDNAHLLENFTNHFDEAVTAIAKAIKEYYPAK